MSVKNQVLHYLEEQKGKSISGEGLAEDLGVSRTAVWKAIQSLKQEGFKIQSAPNKGYMLAEESDLLSPEGIRLALNPHLQHLPIKVFKTIDSTNTEARRMLASNPDFTSGTCILAEQQTAGRGRMGRTFYSPAETGLYISILLKPEFHISRGVLITTAAACAVAKAIEKVCDLDAKIKWVNDVYVDGRKVCGILTEAGSNFETGELDYVIIGIGINCHAPKDGFPDDIKDRAGYLTVSDGLSRNRLAAEIINILYPMCQALDAPDFIGEYKKRLAFMGQDILVRKFAAGAPTDEGIPAVALDVDDAGGLLVKYQDGSREVLNSGEISVKAITEK